MNEMLATEDAPRSSSVGVNKSRSPMMPVLPRNRLEAMQLMKGWERTKTYIYVNSIEIET